MKKLFWLVSGIAVGMAVAKQIETNPKAKALADDVKRTAIEFGTAFAEGFAEREAELDTPVAKAAAKKSPSASKAAAK